MPNSHTKRFASLTLLLVASLQLAAGCTSAPTTEQANVAETPSTASPASVTDVRVAALNGPTAMGMAQMITNARALGQGESASEGAITNASVTPTASPGAGASPTASPIPAATSIQTASSAPTALNTDPNNYNFSLVSSPDEIVAKIVGNEVDIAAIPANLASVLYTKLKGDLQVLNINTLGVLYVVGHDDAGVSSIKDLKGKTLCAAGKGAVPEYTLTYLLAQNGLDITKDVDIQWVPEHAACLALLTENVEALAMLPQPFVTNATAKVASLGVKLDLSEQWNLVNPNSQMLTGVTVVRKAFAEAHPEAIQSFLDTYEASVQYTNDNVAGAAALIGELKIIDQAVAEKAIPECNIVFITGADMKKDLSGFLAVLHSIDPKSVGGSLPGDDFYFGV